MKEKETYILMNGDTPCLSFPKDFKTYTVLNNEMLPYALKDCIDRVQVLTKLCQTRWEKVKEIICTNDLYFKTREGKDYDSSL